MAEADHLCIVFRVSDLGVVMPVEGLMAILDDETCSGLRHAGNRAPVQTGVMTFRQEDITVYSLATLFRLQERSSGPDRRYLVFAGAEQPWALVADQVEGVYEKSLFAFQEVPDYLFEEHGPYRAVAVRKGEPLVSLVAADLEKVFN